MSNSTLLFRQAALDRLSSPDQLDRLVTITSPAGWLALVGLGVLIAAVLTWSVVGYVPTRVSGQGILVARGGSVVDAMAPAAGSLLAVRVSSGDLIEKGQVIADLLQPALKQTLDHARDQVRELEVEHRRLVDQFAHELELKRGALERQRTSQRTVIAGAQQRVHFTSRRSRRSRSLSTESLSRVSGFRMPGRGSKKPSRKASA